MSAQKRTVAMTIAGSDSGGGAGIQMDLRVMHRLGVFGTTAITAVTAQNLRGVAAVEAVSAETVRAQMEAVLAGFEVAAIKTGMLWSASVIDAVSSALSNTTAPLVVDPVMVATSGDSLLDPAAVESYRAFIERGALVTPNLDEASVLLEREVDRTQLSSEAQRLVDRLKCPVLLKGGHLEGDPLDVLADGRSVRKWTHRRVAGVNTHGTGCMLSSAIAAQLAQGRGLSEACAYGLGFVHDALERGARQGEGALADVEAAIVDRSHLTAS